jgi:hypothetical protein
VLERHVEKPALLTIELPVEAGGDRMLRNRQRQRIGCERARRAAEHVARELVEHEHRGETFARRRELLRAQLRHLVVERGKALANRIIDARVLTEPRLGPQLVEPVARDLLHPVALHDPSSRSRRTLLQSRNCMRSAAKLCTLRA